GGWNSRNSGWRSPSCRLTSGKRSSSSAHRASRMKRRLPSAIARWERSRAGSIAHAPGCPICSPSTAPTTSARIIRRAQFCRRAGAADPPRAHSASIQVKEEAPARPNPGGSTRAPENHTEAYSRNRRRTAPNEGDDGGDHEQDDRNDEDDFCNLDRETCDPAKAEYGRNQRNDQERQNEQNAGRFRRGSRIRDAHPR